MFHALRLRTDSGKTRDEVAAETGLTKETIRKIETREDYHPRPQSLKKLGDYYGVKASTLRTKPGETVYLKPGDVVPEGVMAFVVKEKPE